MSGMRANLEIAALHSIGEVETMIRGGFWRRVAIARTAIATGRITSSTVSSVSLGTIHGIFESQQKGTARLCACLKGRVFADNRLCRGDSSTIDKSSLNDPMVVRFCVSPTGVGNNSRHSWVTRGIRIAAEVELKEGETAQLPEELGESLESESWSVGLDGLNVGNCCAEQCLHTRYRSRCFWCYCRPERWYSRGSGRSMCENTGWKNYETTA